VDIGAFESQGFTLSIMPGSSPQQTSIGTPFSNPLTVAVTPNNPSEPVAGGTLTFTASEAGASAELSPGGGVQIGADGQASVTAVANATAGSYSVIARAGLAPAVAFSLTNTTATAAQATVAQSSSESAPVSASVIDQALEDLGDESGSSS
jgi:hypothetical protein